MLVNRGVVHISREAVELIDDDISKLLARAVGYHLLELRTAVIRSGHGAVDIMMHDIYGNY
ncbi:MAG: hypothetical protein SO436_08515 [Oscillospiraceae bacterium]|nr:hypothetical protein [Oscillospiraceae bacterium]